jgi:methylamine---glutamate N-methyltransferase subunit A
MCGIVGLFIKDRALEPQLGWLLSRMMATMCDRGPDSAGFAVFGECREGFVKLTLNAEEPSSTFADLRSSVEGALGRAVAFERRGNHGVLTVSASDLAATEGRIVSSHPDVRVTSVGEAIEIYKDVGHPTEVASRFGLEGMSGTHAIGHTRMATESSVTTLGAHPFSTGLDQCLVHNGSLSNHNNVRRELRREGVRFETENDSEVAAAYLTRRMKDGLGLGGALERSIADLDGFYTFVVGTKTGFGVLRDPIACKPATMAETDRYVAFGSEYRALVDLPGISEATIWEPEPATVYFWQH